MPAAATAIIKRLGLDILKLSWRSRFHARPLVAMMPSMSLKIHEKKSVLAALAPQQVLKSAGNDTCDNSSTCQFRGTELDLLQRVASARIKVSSKAGVLRWPELRAIIRSYDLTPGFRCRRRHQGVRRHSRAIATDAGVNCARPPARLRVPARADRTSFSRLDPCRPYRRTGAGAGSDAVVAIFLFRAAGGLGGVLADGA